YTGLLSLNAVSRKIVTVEDPIEYQLRGINQIQVKPQIGLDFANLLRSILRQDPDVIMVGEVRDIETAQIAVQAALTGHLVLSTLHTNDAPTAVTRLLDLGVPSYLISSTLLGVMAQRLVRTLCPHCKKPADPPDDETWRLLTHPWRAEKPAQVMAPVGCLECRMTGYYGRIGLFEIMPMTPTIRHLTTHEADDAKIREQSYKDGMKPLRVSGAAKVAAGLTTAEEVIKVAPLA
ncbi:MAG: Flp pilus assembly complex ATPase component TadA, partial [Pseudomonadota bacterium]|nr:Flp pilus assembly complex ATPase component TadA [Pseudomonadota bacterium]